MDVQTMVDTDGQIEEITGLPEFYTNSEYIQVIISISD